MHMKLSFDPDSATIGEIVEFARALVQLGADPNDVVERDDDGNVVYTIDTMSSPWSHRAEDGSDLFVSSGSSTSPTAPSGHQGADAASEASAKPEDDADAQHSPHSSRSSSPFGTAPLGFDAVAVSEAVRDVIGDKAVGAVLDALRYGRRDHRR